MKRLLLTLIVFVSACTFSAPDGGGSLIPDSPPPARLVVGAQEQLSGIGSYCWSGSQGSAICADMIGLPTPRQALRVDAPFTAEVILPLDQVPNELNVTWIRAEEEMRLDFESPNEIYWQPLGGEVLPSPPAVESQFEIQAESGLYLLIVSAMWEPYGSVSYGFLVDVAAP